MSVDKCGHFSVDKERSENLNRRVNWRVTEGLFIDEDGYLNAQNKRIKNGALDNNDLATKQ